MLYIFIQTLKKTKLIVPEIILLIIITLFWSIECLSQSIINTTGNSLLGTSTTFEYSIGEMAVETIDNTLNSITQGLLQPDYQVPTALQAGLVVKSIHAFPLPASNYLNIICERKFKYFQINSLDAKIVKEGNIEVDQVVNLENLNDGFYIISLYSASTEPLMFLKIIIK